MVRQFGKRKDCLHMLKKLVAILALCVCLGTYATYNLSAAQRCCEGEEWLKWSAETQTAYLTALLFGTDRGFGDGCFEGLVQASSSPKEIDERSLRACLNKKPRFGKDIAVYVHKITSFYQAYPKDRALTVQQVFREFSDDRDRTAKQVHQKLIVEGRWD